MLLSNVVSEQWAKTPGILRGTNYTRQKVKPKARARAKAKAKEERPKEEKAKEAKPKAKERLLEGELANPL